MEFSLILKFNKESNEIQIIIPKDDKELICESIKLDRSLSKISVNGPWSNVLKSKITKGYSQLGKSEAVAKTLIKEGLFDAVTHLQAQHMEDIEKAIGNKEDEEKQRLKKQREGILSESQEFKQYLTEHNATLMDFLDHATRWLLSGESKNIQTVFFAHFSTLTGLRPVWTIFLGGPGEGKTAIEQAGADLVPKRFKFGGRATYAATMNQADELGNDFLDRCVISLGDLGGKNSYIKWEETLDVYKELSSEGEYDYKRMNDSIDPETKKRAVLRIKIIGYPSVSFASTHSDGLTGQYLSRGITLTPMGSDEDVLKYRRHTRPGTMALDFYEQITGDTMDLFHSYVEDLLLELETHDVINPYYFCLQDWFKKANNNKRASEMFPYLVDAVTLFNYENRHSVTSPNGKVYYISTKEDNETIANLFDITPGLTAEVVAFYNRLVKVVGKYNYDEFEDYQNEAKTIKQCKTIFTVATLKNQRLRKSSSDEKKQFADFCSLLHDTGYLDSLTKNSKGHHVYCLNKAKEIGSAEIDFRSELIREYLNEEMFNQKWGMGLSEAEIMKCMSNEKPQNSITNTFVSPPWDTFGTPSQLDSTNNLGSIENQATSTSDTAK
jgi:hypothetical protein